MDTIEKALNKHRQSEEKKLAQDTVTEYVEQPVDKSIDGGAQAAVEIGIPDVNNAQSITNANSTDNYLEIGIDLLKQIGAILPDNSRSKIKEEYKHIKRPLLQKAMSSTGTKTLNNLIMVTSAYSSEGKTFSSLNLALSIAVERDCRVLLVDADVVKPGLGRMLQIGDKPGLVEYLNGEIDCLSEILLTTNIHHLTVLPAGKVHHLSHELLASNSMYKLAQELSNRYPDRIIIFDSPPVLITSEAKVLADVVGQIALVVVQDKTTQQAVKDVLAKLGTSKVSGLILNKSHTLGEEYYGYYYSE